MRTVKLHPAVIALSCGVALAASEQAQAVAVANASPPAYQSISWASWASAPAPGGSTAVITTGNGPVNVTYVGNSPSVGPIYDWSVSPSVYGGGTIVNNTATLAQGGVKTVGGGSSLNTITFSSPVTNPVMSIYSLGALFGPGSPPLFNPTPVQAQYDFSNSLSISLLSGGPSPSDGGGSLTVSGSSVIGTEGNGVVMFNGTFSTIAFQAPVSENYQVWTIGIPQAVPEPGTWALMFSGMAVVGAFARRQTKAASAV
jgi:PEP-CTERM motif